MGRRLPEARVDLPAAVPDWIRDSLASGFTVDELVQRFARLAAVIDGSEELERERAAFERRLKRIAEEQAQRQRRKYWDSKRKKRT